MPTATSELRPALPIEQTQPAASCHGKVGKQLWGPGPWCRELLRSIRGGAEGGWPGLARGISGGLSSLRTSPEGGGLSVWGTGVLKKG